MSLKSMFFVVLLVTLQKCYCQDFQLNNNNNNVCKTQETCGECLQEIECIWCVSPKTAENETEPVHCRSRISVIGEDWCPDNSKIDPAPLCFMTVRENEESQITPQHVRLKLRRGEKCQVNFKYTQRRDYPADLYYIMDLSASMVDHKDKLAALGEKLAAEMRKLTKNFRLGFGSFVDKVDLPFTGTHPNYLKSPCSLKQGTVICESPYSFKNQLSLTNSSAEFARKVQAARVSGNIDAPEGGLDAMMQAIVCKDEIGWRTQARHLLVYSTDTHFHIAGDGKLAGVIEPNDAKCHMVNNSYTDYLIYDYPSVSHINYIAKENNINIIFAIVNNPSAVDVYTQLSQRIENSNIGFLSGNSDNVINLVTDNYNKIVDTVSITSNASSDVSVKITSNCKTPTENGCADVHVGETVQFTATIQPLECSSNNKKLIRIKPQALEESLLVELEVECDCGCNNHESYEQNSQLCTKGNGDMSCGICSCHQGWFGKKCECDILMSQTEDVANCINNGQLCSGQGTCKCGICHCDRLANPEEVISGKYCQCKNYDCPRGKNGELCSGEGKCKCGQCECSAEWIKDDCSCHDTNSTCIAPGDKDICSGHGKCVCGQCECFPDGEETYIGEYCGQCKTCPAQRCDELSPCVQCQAYKSGPLNEQTCKTECTKFTTEIIPNFNSSEQSKYVKICRIIDSTDGCTITFVYSDNDEGTNVKALKDKVCSAPLSPEAIRKRNLAWILGVIGSIVAAGLIILLVWKICTTVHDKREYAKFEKERQALKWHRSENPLYKGATTTFANPAYNRSSRSSTKKE